MTTATSLAMVVAIVATTVTAFATTSAATTAATASAAHQGIHFFFGGFAYFEYGAFEVEVLACQGVVKVDLYNCIGYFNYLSIQSVTF